jgi:hypothetical protein
MARIDYSFQGSAKALHLDCRVKDFWEEKKKTFCFSEEIKVPWKFDYTLKTRVSVFPYPVSLHASHAQYALSKPETGLFQKIPFTIDNETLALDIFLSKPDGTFNEDLPRHRTTTGKLCIAWEHFVQFYRIDLLVVFDSPPVGRLQLNMNGLVDFFPVVCQA